MPKKKLLWQLYSSYLLVTVLALAALVYYASKSFEDFFLKQTALELESAARLVSLMISNEGAIGDAKSIDKLCKDVGKTGMGRATVILPSGKVIGDSEEDPSSMEDHLGRPEVREAIQSQVGTFTRFSHTLNKKMMYVAIPMLEDRKLLAVVRMSKPLKTMTGALGHLHAQILLEVILVAVLVAALILAFSKRVMKPLEEIRRGAKKFLEGDLTYKLRVKGSNEVMELAETMNQMANELQEKIERSKKMEDMRREFVANVSHELKTPITSIKGFAETLKDGALSDPEKAQQFLNIIAAHAGRIGTIIEDLLNLSRIEKESEDKQIFMEMGRIKEVINNAVSMCEGKAHDKNIQIHKSCGDEIAAKINPALLEQAISNLIDNAIKYSESGSSINVAASISGNAVRIMVKDLGCGIPPEHLPRIFERFYRVDKGRSRKLGGTGLGLAIVKHIVQVHGGSVDVESKVGEGSVFTIVLLC